MHNERSLVINDFLNGRIDRRKFIRRAVAAGVSAPIVAGLLSAYPRMGLAQETALPDPTAPRPDADLAPDDQQIARFLQTAPFRMDPPTNTTAGWALQSLVFCCLARVDIGSQIVPGVADSWETNDDLTSWTFHLNPSAAYSDGTPITAAEVKWTWDWYANPNSGSIGSDVIVNNVVGYEAVRNGEAESIEGIVVVDPQTITFNLTATDPVFLAKAASYQTGVLKPENVQAGGAEWWREPVTSGFFKVTEYTPGDTGTMTLEPNEHWWREPALLKKVQYQVVADPQTVQVMYDNDELDSVPATPAEFAQAIDPASERHAELFWRQVEATWYFGFFIEKAPFDEVPVRQAFTSAIDHNLLSSAVLGGLFTPQQRILPAWFPCGSDDQFMLTYDVERAKQFLAESSYGGPENFPPTTILVSEPGGATAPGIWGRMAQAIQQQLQENLGVQVEVIRKVYGSLEEQQQEARAVEGGVIFRLSFGVSLIDPSYIGPIVQTGSSRNASGYSNPRVDELLTESAVETDEDRRCELFTEIDKIVSEESVFLAPFRGSAAGFFKPRVRGIDVNLGSFEAAIHKMYIAAE